MMIFLVGGLNDIRGITGGWERGFRDAGLPHERAVVKWQQGGWSYLTQSDLWKTTLHAEAGERLAQSIRAHRAAHGKTPIHIVAHSAGTAVTACALKCLAPAEAIASAIFVGSALSPGYDLLPIFERCEFGLLAVESRLDCFHLGLGTTLLGTADRVFAPAAGMVGFRTRHPKLHALKWQPRFVRQGWLGEHLTQGHPAFARETLAAWIRYAEGEPSVPRRAKSVSDWR